MPSGTGYKSELKFIPSRETPALANANNGIIPNATYGLTPCSIFVNKENRQSILVNGESLPLPKFVFPRTGSGTTYHIKAVIRHFERMSVIVINGSDAIDNVKDKLYSHQILAQSNLDIPKTLLLKHPIDVDFVQKHLGFPVIIKTISGSYGKGVFIAETKKQLSQLITMAELTKTAKKSNTIMCLKLYSGLFIQKLKLYFKKK